MARAIFIVVLFLSVTAFFYYLKLSENRNAEPVATPEATSAVAGPPEQTDNGKAENSGAQSETTSGQPAPDEKAQEVQTTPDEETSGNAAYVEVDIGDSNPLLTGDYANYEDRVLRELIINGDVTAMQVLAMRYLTGTGTDKSPAKGLDLMQGAAVYGANHYPFKSMAAESSRELRQAALNDAKMPDDKAHEALVETFAYYELAAMRGNASLKHSMVSAFAEQYDIKPSNGEWSEIKARAQTKYEELQKYRNQLGLGPLGGAATGD